MPCSSCFDSYYLRAFFRAMRWGLRGSLLLLVVGTIAFVPGSLCDTAGAAVTRQPVVAARPVAAVAAPPAYTLRYKFQRGKDVSMVVDVDSQIRVQKGETVTVAKMRSTTERHFHVDSVEPDGSAVLGLVIDNVRMSRSFDNSPAINYDTRSDDRPTAEFKPVKDSMGIVLGQMEVAGRGEMRSLVVRENLTNDRRIMMNDASENFLDVLPEKPVRVGDEWSDDVKISVSVSRSLQQKITVRRRYTLVAVNGNVATIHLSMAELVPIDDPFIRGQLVQKTPEGTILFDMNLGMVTSRKLRCCRTETGVMGEGSVIAGLSNLECRLQ
jgi:Family of unknown function (DUF6263)